MSQAGDYSSAPGNQLPSSPQHSAIPNGATSVQLTKSSRRPSSPRLDLETEEEHFETPTTELEPQETPLQHGSNDGFPFYSNSTKLGDPPETPNDGLTDHDFITPGAQRLFPATISEPALGETFTESEFGRPSVTFSRPITNTNDELGTPDLSTVVSSDSTNPQARKSKFVARMLGLTLSSPTSSKIQTTSSATADAGATKSLSATSDNESGPLRLNQSGTAVDASTANGKLQGNSGETSSAYEQRRVRDGGTRTAPSTPKKSTFPTWSLTPGPHTEQRPVFFRSNSHDGQQHSDQTDESEDDERTRERFGWKRKGSAWMAGVRQNAARRASTQETTDSSRPNPLRKITGIGNSTPAGEPGSSTWKIQSEQAAQKWRQLRANLKLIGRERKKAAAKIDQSKSTELVAELLAGSPAALLLASRFQPDEGKRVPVLLEQLKISITDSQTKEPAGSERNPIFRIELEYGSGDIRMKWTIHRSFRDFYDLHVRYVAEASLHRFQRHRSDGSSRVKLPRFPRTAFPYFRDFRRLADEEEWEEEDDTADEPFEDEGQTPVMEKSSKGKRRVSTSNQPITRTSTGRAESIMTASPIRDRNNSVDMRNTSSLPKSDRYAEKARKKLEVYLRSLVRFVMFRPGANRMCRFLELSALGVRLSGEGGYHGKEGRMVLQSGSGIDFRRAWTPSLLIERHRPMWFLIRQSYIVCVDTPADMNIYDVFLVDSHFTVSPKRARVRDQQTAKDIAKTARQAARHPQNHTLKVANSERRLKLVAKDERQLGQFEESIRYMLDHTEWSRPKRFSSFAPIRHKAHCQWFVDGRDYMWNLSRALDMARDVIYIHNWWISPELFMRRPPAISQRWRLDRILKRKAEEGVKIFVIVYRNINQTIPIDSEYTKFALLDLHPNIFVQRSPNQVRQNVFFWAHHEKMCVIDHTVVFLGGMDLCYGRWDTPNHSVVDDRPLGWDEKEPGMPLNSDTCQIWAGKDYSNPRTSDFFRLDEPYEEMYDRTKVGRTPWHDVGVRISGHAARDAARHFVQRWNYILRQRKPSRPTPFLLPPTDFTASDLKALDVEGSCTVQMLRSAGEWSLGTAETEHSILDAYCKLIEISEHFIYIENQFFITSCTMENTKVQNAIGDALVERIIRAHQQGEDWLAIIVIPLLPGFENTVDKEGGSSIRLIMQFQYRTICRGPTSIFERLRKEGINPEDYISFYSLRSWGKLGKQKALITDQLYIHAKTMIVDDRHAIIGSANINERSMLGNRDSEIATLIFDHDMIDSTMGGEPYKVGRFPHTLRMRLMREHLGLDVDSIYEGDGDSTEASRSVSLDTGSRSTPPSSSTSAEDRESLSRLSTFEAQQAVLRSLNIHTFNHDVDWEQEHNKHIRTNKPLTYDPRVTNTIEHKKDVEGYGIDNMHAFEGQKSSFGRDTVTLNGHEIMVNDVSAEGHGTIGAPVKAKNEESTKISQNSRIDDTRGTKNALYPPSMPPRLHTEEMGLTLLSQLPPLPALDDTDIGGPPLQRTLSRGSTENLNPFFANMRRPMIDKDCMRDPLNDSFFRDTWCTVAKNNTRLFRQVFRCMPDSEVTSWPQYNAAMSYAQRFAESQGLGKAYIRPPPPSSGRGPSAHDVEPGEDKLNAAKVRAGEALDGHRKRASSLGHKTAGSASNPRNMELNEKAQAHQQNLDEKQDSSISGAEISTALDEKGSIPASSTSKLVAEPESIFSRQSNTIESNNEKMPHSNAEIGSLDTRVGSTSKRRRRRNTTRSSGGPRPSDTPMDKANAEELMKLVQGNLVEWSYDWLCQEERGGKWLYYVDQLQPMEIYN